MAAILVIDDEQEILKMIQRTLEPQGYVVHTATTVSEILPSVLQLADLILLDVMMPGEDGFSFCQRIRGQVEVPIIFMTARNTEADLIYGLGLGADDYITKPFSIGELRARVAAHLRRESRQVVQVLRWGKLRLDIGAKQLFYDNQVITLTKTEFNVCETLLRHAGQVFSKGQLYENVFGYEGLSDESAMVEHIKNIRAKLKVYGCEPIETVWGIGYRWRRDEQRV